MLKAIKDNKKDLLIITGLIVLSTVIMFSLGSGESELHKDLHSSKYTGFKGTKAFYLLCEELEYNIDRLDRFEQLQESCKVLLMISPKVVIADDHIASLERWVRDGGVLICDSGILPDDSIAALYGGASGKVKEEENILARDVTKTSWEFRYSFDMDDTEEYKVLYYENSKARIIEKELGLGKIIRLVSPDILTNTNLSLDDNSVLAINLVHYALGGIRAGEVLFDESHYREYKDIETSYTLLGNMLANTPWGWFVVSLAVAGMCYIWQQGKRFGPVRQLPGQRRRAKLEYVHSAGSCWTNAGAYPLMFELNYKWLRGKFSESVGLPATCDNISLSAEIAKRTEGQEGYYRDILDRAGAALESEISKREVKNLIKELGKIELELSDGYRKS